MTPEFWPRVEAIYHEALARDPAARQAYLAKACQDDPALRSEVESLLEQPETGGWLDRPPLDPSGAGSGVKYTAQGSAAIDLPPGVELSHFRIESSLSAGGMGRVYHARDTLLNRSVAIKVIRSDIKSDAISKRRFVQEAKAASALNHPNIVTIYEIGAVDGVDFIAMEYVNGTTLEEWIRGGNRQLSVSLPWAIQIADALAAAHAAGIVHRDLKPANVMVTPQGIVKVLDFGLAKWSASVVADPEAGGGLEAGPRTTAGLVVGTPPYASPEQAEGKVVDARSDIFSFGALIYELVTGARAFVGDSPIATWSAILTQEPTPVRERVPTAPLELDALVGDCLRKDPRTRVQSMRDVRIALEGIERKLAPGAKPPLPPAPTAGKRWQRRTVTVAILLAVGLLAGAAYSFLSRNRGARPELRYTQVTDFTDSAVAPALSPDGRMVTFIRGELPFLSRDQIYVKLLPNGDAVKLTESPAQKYGPVFSPDGTRIAFTTNGLADWNTYTVSPLGGEAKLMVRNAAGLTWLNDKVLLFSALSGRGMNMGIVVANENRSHVRDIYWPAHERAMAHYSYASPDRKWALVVEMDHVPWWRPCRLISLTGDSRSSEVGPRGKCTSAGWSPDGSWMYFAAEVDGEHHLWRQPFPSGAPEQLTFGATEEDGIAVDPDGRSLITSVGIHKTAIWIHDSKGERQISSEGLVSSYAERVLASSLGHSSSPTFSRDGRHLYYLRKRESAGPAIGLQRLDLSSGSSESLLTGFSIVEYDLSPDEREVVFSRSNGPTSDKLEIWLAPLDDSAAPTLVASNGEDAPHFGPDGDLVVRVNEAQASYIYRMDRHGGGRVKVFDHPAHNFLRVSPDRQWALVFSATLGGMFVVPLRGGPARQIFTKCCFARWAPDGRYLYVLQRAATLNNPGEVIAVPLLQGRMVPDNLTVPNSEGRTDFTQLSSTHVIPHAEVFPGPDPSTYAFVKTTVNRNLFRITLR